MTDPAADSPKPIAQPFWNDGRTELRAWFERHARSLGELYEGVLQLLYTDRPIPGWPRFAAHGMRDIANRLPDVFGGAKKKTQLQYKNQVDGIVKAWRKSGLPLTSGSLASGAIPAQPAADVAVPHVVFRRIQVLVEEHLETREKPAEAAGRLFAAFSAEGHDSNMRLGPIITEWVAVTAWFQERAHDRLVPDEGYDRAEFRARFEQAERMLMALVRDFFKTTKDLDEILEDTNN